ncbi:MAG TPA: hypothetical protein VFP72_15935 [Kineosporiaceae bacterium]|nr:hypothetical protein [Kineosporiaceae bacterium]
MRVLSMLVAATVLGWSIRFVTGASAPSDPPPPVMPTSTFVGTLLPVPEHVGQEASAGVSDAMVELSWRRYEPRPGWFDPSYVRGVRDEVRHLHEVGRQVTLGLGLNDPPAWAYDVPDSRFVDQHGAVSEQLNLVFNGTLRELAAHYLTQVVHDLGAGAFRAVRLTSGGSAEVLYPPGGYWAFDANATGGTDRPASLPADPVPGWRPGTAEAASSPAQALAFAQWYVACLTDVLIWQRNVLRSLGFHGWYYVLTPGVGVRPAEFDQAVAAGLPDGLLGQGAVWPQLYGQLPPTGDWVAYVTSVGDGSGDADTCSPADATVALTDPRTLTWSATRWITRIAAGAGIPVSGENPGLSDGVLAGYQDTSSEGMLARVRSQVIGCGLRGFYWAHDEQLWDGTLPFGAFAHLTAALTAKRPGTRRP